MKNAFLHEYETKKALSEFILRSSRLSMDQECLKFEQNFKEFQNASFATLVNSGGSANLLILQSLKNLGRLKTGDKVGFSSLTWSTNVMPIIQLGFIPVPIDVCIHNMNVNSEQLKIAIASHDLKAFFTTNVLGFTGDLNNISQLCEDENIILIEDNCESLGTKLNKGDLAGNYGIASSFSFFVAHHMSTIEGGMVVTKDEELHEMVVMARANGWDRNLSSGQQHRLRKTHKICSELEAKYTFYDLGFNFRPTEITGFLGNYQLRFLKENINFRETTYFETQKIVNHNHDFLSFNSTHIERLSTFALPFICKTKELKEHYIKQFAGAGIEIRPMIAGDITKQPFFKKYCTSEFHLENVNTIHNNGFYCGNYPELTQTDKETIWSCILK